MMFILLFTLVLPSVIVIFYLHRYHVINAIDYKRIKLDKEIRRDAVLLLQDTERIIKENNEIKIEKASDEEAQDDFYTLNSHRFD